MTPRDQYGRHTFVGANVFVLEMFKQYGAQLGLTQGDPNYDTNTFNFVPRLDLAIKETTTQVQNKTASVAIRGQRRGASGLEVDVQVINLPATNCHPVSVSAAPTSSSPRLMRVAISCGRRAAARTKVC